MRHRIAGTVRERLRRIDRETVALSIGDMAVLSSFVAYGLLSHAINPLDFPVHSVLTAIPFVIAWWLVAPVGGLYRTSTVRSVRATLLRVITVWTVVSLLGGAIRATSFFDGEAPPIFLLANLVFGLGFLLPWRLAVVLRYRYLS